MGNAELWTSALLKEDTSDWRVLELVWFATGRQDCVFWGGF